MFAPRRAVVAIALVGGAAAGYTLGRSTAPATSPAPVARTVAVPTARASAAVPPAPASPPGDPVADAVARWRDGDPEDPATRAAVVAAAERALVARLAHEAPSHAVATLAASPTEALAGDAIALASDELLVTWCLPAAESHTGCLATSAFARGDAGWRVAGRVRHDAFSVYPVVDVDARVAYLIGSYAGNGAPPDQVTAVAIVDGRLAALPAPPTLVARVEPSVGAPGVELRGRYPRLGDASAAWRARWWVTRDRGGLVAHLRSLAPWLDALAAACIALDPDAMTSAVFARLRGCQDVSSIRILPDGRVRAQVLAGLDAGDEREEREVTLVLRVVGGRWQVAAIDD